MKLIIEINTENAAFEENGELEEVEWILNTQLKLKESALLDSNGNVVGSVKTE